MPERESETALGFQALPPAGAEAAPGVVLIPDVWGLSAHYRAEAARLAREGFAVLALDPYRKTGTRKLESPEDALAWIDELPDPVVLETVQEGIAHLAALPGASGRVGITGFCMGGQYALLAACMCRGLSACAPFYGMLRYRKGLNPAKKPRQPLDALGTLQCPVLGFYGEADPIIPTADALELREKLAASKQPGEVILYPNAGHAFANPTRPELYRPEAARDAWEKLVPFLRETLRATSPERP